jgi:phage terminase large subunit-like protein
MKGWAYYLLKDFERSRESFQALPVEFKEFQEDCDSARKGIRWLNTLQKKTGR